MPDSARQVRWIACAGTVDQLTDPVLDLSEEPGAVVPHAGICAGGRLKGRSLPRLTCWPIEWPAVPVPANCPDGGRHLVTIGNYTGTSR